MTKDPNSPFNWYLRNGPSIFAQDPYFRPKADGKTDSQRATDTVEKRRVNGIDPGTISNLGKHTKEKEAQLLAYRQFGTYSKANEIQKETRGH